MLGVVILGAGQGKRMISDLPKVLHPIGGKAMIHHVIDAALELTPSDLVVVISPTLDAHVIQGGRPSKIAIQELPLGTGDAVKSGLAVLPETPDTVLVLCGDTPLLTSDMLEAIVTYHQARGGITVVGMHVEAQNTYGRLILNEAGTLDRIVEFRDANSEERAISLCNSGVIVADGPLLKRLVAQLSPQNEAGEYYLTDIVALAAQDKVTTSVVELPATAMQGINNRVDLSAAEKAMQQRWRRMFMEEGVTLIDPDSVFFSHDTKIGRDVTISPNVTFGPSVTLGNRVRILPGCHLDQSAVGNDVTVGPFAHLRDGVILGDHVAIGNFVEVKGSTLGAKTKAKHLSYLGNATIGENTNIGAGTITCNHNGFVKSQTHIGSHSYIGSNSCLVAPVSIGTGAIVAAGSVVTSNVEDNALAIARIPQENKGAWATQFRSRYAKGIVARDGLITSMDWEPQAAQDLLKSKE